MARRITDIVNEGEVLGVVAGAAASVPLAATASDVTFTPTGDLVATDVQAALAELDSEKLSDVAIADITATGTPSASTYLRGDGSWSTPAGGGGGAGELLAVVQYDLAANASTTSTSFVDVDATNLAVTFTAPASGKVIIQMTADWEATTNIQYFWGLRVGASDVASSERRIAKTTAGTGVVSQGAVGHYELLVTGLTSTTSYTYKMAHRVSAGTGFVMGDHGPVLLKAVVAPA